MPQNSSMIKRLSLIHIFLLLRLLLGLALDILKNPPHPLGDTLGAVDGPHGPRAQHGGAHHPLYIVDRALGHPHRLQIEPRLPFPQPDSGELAFYVAQLLSLIHI